MNIDMRGFADPLQALRCRQQWQRDRAQLALARAQAALDQARRALTAMQDEHARAMSTCARINFQHLDPVRHRHMLCWLAESTARLRQQAERVGEAEGRRDALRQQCRQRQWHLDLSLRQRQECLRAYRARAQGLLARDADVDWLSRSLWRKTAAQAEPVQELSPW